MLKIIVITHGTFSEGIRSSLEMILGKQEEFLTYSILENCDLESVKSELNDELEKSSDSGQEVLFLSDLFFGTPFNLITPLMEHHRFFHITGINLPLVMEIVSNRNAEDIPGMLQESLSLGQSAMLDCVDYLKSAMGSRKEDY